ncbi:hypothetical protein Tco_0887410 [Tanacetum coccineum]
MGGFWFRKWNSRDVTHLFLFTQVHVLAACTPFVPSWKASMFALFLGNPCVDPNNTASFVLTPTKPGDYLTQSEPAAAAESVSVADRQVFRINTEEVMAAECERLERSRAEEVADLALFSSQSGTPELEI